MFGKLPSRGDFVRLGLPREFLDPWDDWWQARLLHNRGADWLACWLVAPIWRFALGPGLCGPQGTFGLWMPSVDRAGRYYPLTLAATAPPGHGSLDDVAPLLDLFEDAGLDALANDTPPDTLAAAIQAATTAQENWPALSPGQARWWTEGSERVAPRCWISAGLPGAADFTAMLDDCSVPVASI